MPARRVIATLCVALSVSMPAAPGFAHEERSLHSLTVLDRVTPQIDGLELRVVHLDGPAIAVRNLSGSIVTVLGEDGEPFLKIGPRGVFANVASATTYRSIDPQADEVPPGIGARSGWAKLSDDPAWSWFDPRLMPAPNRSGWRIAMRAGTDTVVASGSYEPLQGHGHFVTDADTPAVRGLDLRLLQGTIPAVFVRNETGRVLLVPGRAGEPFLEIGPGGVRANLMSPSYYSGGAQRIAPMPRWVDPDAAPRWKRVSAQPVWGWLDQRAALPVELQQRSLLGPHMRTIHRWTIEMTLGTELLPLTGRVEWVPPAAPDALPPHRFDLTRVGLVAVFLIVGAALVRTSRRLPSPA